MNELEQQKIALTKELEKVQEEINYYNLDQIAHGNEEFKDMINKRDRIRHKIEEIKKEIGEEYYTKKFTDDFNIIDSYINDLEETLKKQAEYIKELEKEV